MSKQTWNLRNLLRVGLLCLAMFALWQVVSPITRQPAQASSSVTDQSLHPALTRPIETIRPGMRVVAGNPETEGPAAADSPIEPQGWRLFRLRMAKPDGSQLDVELLRPMEWALAQGLERAEQVNDQTFGLPRPLTIAPSELALAELILGKELLLDLPELGASGPATVTAVLPCPEIEAVRGVSQRLVTGTFHHSAANVIDLQVASEKEPIGTTDNHPFWSEDRRDFIPAGELQLGETLLLANGTHTQVTRITPHTGPPVEVFNLEVDVDHTYHVGNGGVLVHNAYPWQSVPEFGHTFLTHGQGPKVFRSLMGRAGGTGKAQGQWINNAKAADFLTAAKSATGGADVTIRLPPGLGQNILPGGAIVPAEWGTLIFKPNGTFRTGFPILPGN